MRQPICAFFDGSFVATEAMIAIEAINLMRMK
jgi:hypothetical protein